MSLMFALLIALSMLAFYSFKELVGRRPLSQLTTCQLNANAWETKKEIHIDSMDETSKSKSVGLIEAKELVKYVASLEV